MTCDYCELRCPLETGDGVCGRYYYDADQILEAQPFHFLEPGISEIEGVPFFHVVPGQYALQTGTKGCNAGCDYCINAHVAIEQSDKALNQYTPDNLIAMAEARQASAIVFAINEVTMYLPSAIEVAKAAHRAGLLVGCLTNGFQTEEAALELATHMDMINVSLKSMSDKFYQKSLQLRSVQPVLRNIGIFSKHAYVEIITPVAQEIGMDELGEMTDFISSIDPLIPWHLFRLYRTHQRSEESGRDWAEIIGFTETVRERLPYTYFSNFPGSKWVDTLCPSCGHRVVRRVSIGACGAQYVENELTAEDTCPKCGHVIPIVRPQQ